MQTPKFPRRTAKRFATVLTAFVFVAALAATFLYINGRSANTTYYSKTSLPPELVTSWSTTRDGLGVPPADFNGANDSFVIQNAHNMTTAAAWSVMGLNTKIQIESGGTLTANHAITVPASTTFQIDGGGTYIHNNTGAPTTTIFQGTESFATSSNFEIKNFSTAAIPVVTGGFGNLTINAPSLTQSWNQTSNLTSIKGNFNVLATGGGTLEMRLANATDYTLNIGGNLTISGGILNISNGSSAAKVINLGGNFNQSGGTFTSGTGTTQVNFSGGASFVNFTKTAGTLTPTNINWSIASGKTVQFDNVFTNAASRTFTVNSGGILLAAATITNGGTMNVNGDFRLTDGGFANGTGAFTYGANGILSFTTASGYTVDGTHAYWPTTNGPQNVNVLFGGITMNAARTVSGLFQYASGVSGANNLTLNGTSQVNPGGFVSGSPTYGASSLLKYNTGGNYGRNGEWLPGATGGAGYPNNVQLSGNTSLDLPNGSTTQPFQMRGFLQIDAGSTMQMAGSTPLAQPLNVLGPVSNLGTLTLSTALGGDIKVGGDWVRSLSSTFNPNGRAVIFNGSTDQLISCDGPTETFNYLVVNKPGGSLLLASNNNTNVTVNGTTGDVLQLLGGDIVLNGRTFTMSGNGGNILVSGGARSIINGGFFKLTGSKIVTSASGGALAFTSPVELSNAVDFGAGTTTIQSSLIVKSGGSVNTNPPVYGNSSTLQYDTGGVYNASTEFPSAAVRSVNLLSTTQLNLDNNKTITGSFSVNNSIVGSTDSTLRDLTAGSVSISNGSLNVGNLTAATASVFNSVAGGGQINLNGNWNVTTLNDTGSVPGTVNFNGTGAQAIQTANTFKNLTASNDITLGANTAVNNTLALGAKKITTGANTLALGNAAIVTRTSGYVLGTLQKSFNAPADFTFPVGTANGYSPVEANGTSGTGTLAVNAVQQPYPSVNATNSLQRYWTLSGSGITTNLTFNYLDGDVNVTAPVTEADYKVFKFNSPPTLPPAQSLDPDNNKATVNGVSTFSDWTLAADSAVYGSLQFDMSSYSVNEDAGTITLNVTRTGGSNGAVGVSYTTVDGTATSGAGNDYTGNDGTLNWADGDTESKPITIAILDDTAFEGDQAFNVNITNPTGGAVLGTPNDVAVTINENDPNTPQAPPSVVYVDDNFANPTAGQDPDGTGPATNFGYDSFSTIQGGVDGVASGGTVNVAAGSYGEDVNIDKSVSLLGAGANSTTIHGPIGGPATTVFVAASNVTVANFTITRDGNNTTDWNNAGLNTAGVAIQGLAVSNALIHDNVITGNRTAVDINNSNGHTVRNNVIDFNRTGLIYRNQTDNQTVVENFITNNWTVGVLFIDASGGTNSPVQSAGHSTFSNNNISANWYGQIVDRQSGGTLPAPGSNPKNFIGNWFGTTSPVVTTANSAEPGYAAQIPVAYGGTATPPGGQPDIAGPASANFKYLPLLQSGTDTDAETTPGRGTFGFQGVQNSTTVTPANQSGWTFFDDNPGVGTGTGGYETGPATPPLGTGSAFLEVDANGRHALGTFAYAGTRFADLSELQYGSYQNNSSNPAYAPSLQFDIDYDLTDTTNPYQGRLVFEPYLSGTVQQNVWQNWDALAGNWYGTRTTVPVGDANVANPCQQATPCTRQQILTLFPNAGVRNTPASRLLFKVGGPWSPGFRGNVDAFKLSVGAAHITYDFEPVASPTFTIDDVSHAEGNAGQTVYVFTVTLSPAANQTSTVDYATVDGTATTANSDYTAASGTLVFNTGDTTKQFTVNVSGDMTFEPDEAFTVHLSNPTGGATIADADGTATVTNDDAPPPPPVVYVDDDFASLPPGADPDGPATNFGYDSFSTIQGGVDGVAPGGTVNVAAGTYHEDVVVNKPVTLHGAGMGVSTISGPSGGGVSTLQVTASNVVINNFTITRDGNAAATWNDPLNTAGIAIQGQAITGMVIHDNLLTGNRTAVDINNSNGHTIRNNSITFNRTGMLLRNQTDNLTVVENFITNNWTVGVLFIDGSGGSNVPPQSAAHSGFNNNDLSGNWYGEVADRQAGGSIPPPGTSNLKNFRNNWFGTTSPVVTTDNTMEPGYAAQVPVEYGGTATNPGGAPDIAGPASANIKYIPFLLSGTDTNIETTPGRGTNGFQGQQSNVVITPATPQGWAFFNDLPGTGTGSGGFEHGPGTPPLGVGSAFLTVDANGRYAFGTGAYAGTRMDDVTTLSYNSYQDNNANTTVAISLQFDIDYDLNDANNSFMGRLVFEPYLSPEQGAVQQNVWQNWDALAGKWYGTRTTATVGNTAGVAQPCQAATPCTWQQVIALFPNAGVRHTPSGTLLFKAGGPWSPGFEGNVDNFRIAINSANTTHDFEPLPQLSINDVMLAEGNSGQTIYTFTVTLSRAFDQTVTVNYATADSTATAPADYGAVPPTQITFAPGETSKEVTVQVNGDGVYEANEQFFVNLSNPSNATVLDGQGIGTITNDDPPPTFAIDDVTRAEGNAGFTAFTFTIIKSGATELPSSVDFTTVDGTAQDDVPPTEDNDYQATSGTRTFAPGEITQAITVLVNGDTAFETNETFTVVLSNPSNATITDGTGLGTIVNDDAPGTALIVNTTNDVDDGSCQPSHCSLREAINAANSNVDTNTISFQIPATDARHFYYADDFVAGQVSLFTVNATTASDDSTIVNIDPDWPHSWWSIRPAVGGLPNITNPVTIDGYTQAGASVNTSPTAENAVLRLELNGTLSGAGIDGFRVITRNSVLRGFSVNRFPGDGVVLKEDVDASNDGDSNAVRGNFIGTDISGTLDLGNGAHGVTTEVDNTAHNSDTNAIGGIVPADRNLISGNNGHGILMTFSSGNLIRGNIIGLAANGSTALGNGGAGVEVTNSTIGGDDDDDGTLDGTIGARNVISANSGNGVQFVSTGGSTVQGNYIGTDASGTLDRGNIGSGISTSGFSKIIGGTEAGARNLISGNEGHGIFISGGNGNVVFGNYIGTQADGTTALGNGSNGVNLTASTIFNSIGGTNAGEANRIAFNAADGIYLEPTAGANNALRGNSIHSNGGTIAHLGIDLGPDGITPNDPQDPDTGANNLQNFPVLSTATVTGTTKKITGTLNSTPNQIFTIDFYANGSCDQPGNGEGHTYLGSITTDTTDANGDVAFSFNPTALNLGEFITATATSNLNSTSEFSACVAVIAGTAGEIRFTSATYTVAENVPGGTASITFERVGGADGQITANFSTSDGTATAGQDYTATSQTVTFNDGETGTKTVNVPILDDNVHEGDETVNLTLGGTTVNIAGRKSLASNATFMAVLTITDAEDTPAISINDVFVSEPPAAGTSNAVFTVTLSNPSNTPVTVDYQTADGTATAPADYNAVTTTQLTFAPGETSKTITVTVNFDNLTEGNETFTVNLSNPSANATIADGTGTGTITDPVAEGQLLISEFRFRGPTYNAGGGVDGSRDEFVELYNNTDAPLTVSTTDGSGGWSVAALSSDGMSAVPLVTIAGGTVIPARAHYLVANSADPINPATGGYSLSAYAAPDQLYLPDIADNSGVAVFATATAANYSPGNRLDAAGFSGTTGATAELFREGAGLTSPGANDGEYAFVRKLVSGFPQDTDVNADDFNFVSTDGGNYGGVQSQLGAPAPENKPTSPVQRNGVVKASLIDGTVSSAAPPNRVRSGQIQPGVPNAYGTLSIQRRFKNTLSVPITRLRFRVVDITTLNTPVASSPQADLRVLSSTGVVTNSQGDEVVTVEGLTLEMPPAQPNGGGLNSSLTVIPPGGMLAPGSSIDVQFLLGVQEQGNFRFLVNVEALPGPSDTPAPEQPNLKRSVRKTNGIGKQ